MLYESVKQSAQHVFILYGDNSDKKNEKVRKELTGMHAEQTMILVATGQDRTLFVFDKTAVGSRGKSYCYHRRIGK